MNVSFTLGHSMYTIGPCSISRTTPTHILPMFVCFKSPSLVSPPQSSGGLRATPTQALRNMMAERRHRRVRSDLPGPPAKGGSYQHF